MSKINHRANAFQAVATFDDKAALVNAVKRVEQIQRRGKAVPKRAKAVPFNANAQQAPVRGDSIAVQHSSDFSIKEDKLGHLFEMSGRLSKSSKEVRTVKHVYLSDVEGYRVQDSAGEVWTVRPAQGGDTKWETINPHNHHVL